jgi:transcriptional regulator with XRE-family HTH domain
MSTNTFGDFVRKARMARGISLRALAEDLGYSSPYLSDIETGKRNPLTEATVLAHLAKLLGVSLDDLRHAAEVSRGSFKLPQASTLHNEVAAALSKKWTKLKPEQLEEILRAVS